MAPSAVFVIGGEEKEMGDLKGAIMAASKKIGPLKVTHAELSVDVVARIQQAGPGLKGVFLNHRLTCPGKEEFSDLIRKIMKDKLPEVPIVCWGKPGKGGDIGKHYHIPLEWEERGGNVAEVVAMVVKLNSGELQANWKDSKKDKKGRKSIDGAASPRPSLEMQAKPKAAASRPSIDRGAAPAVRRKSLDVGADREPPSPASNSMDLNASGRRSNSTQRAARASNEYEQWANMGGMGMGAGGMGGMGNMGMNGMGGGMGGMGGGMGGMGGGMGGMNGMSGMGGGMGGMGGGMGGMGGGMDGMGGGMGVMGGMNGMGGGMGGMGGGMDGMGGGMGGMGGGMGGMGGGMGGMQPMGGMGGMGGMQSMGGMGGMSGMGAGSMGGMGAGSMGGMGAGGMAPGMMPGMGMLPGMGMAPNLGMAVGMPGNGPMGMQSMQPMGGMGMSGMAGMTAMAVPVLAPVAATPADDIAQQVAGMNMAGNPNGELIKSLADEVSRLRKMLEERNAASPMPPPATHPAF